MPTFKHPASLNSRQQFSQACSILRGTTRATNPAWYQEALDLNFQLHIRTDGNAITAFYFNRKKNTWAQGPSLPEDALINPARFDPLLADILRHARSNGATSLGIILHIADELATNELKPELDNPAALNEIREAAFNDPASILEDSTMQADVAAWRVCPYPAAGSPVIGTTITLTRQYAPFFHAIRETAEKENFPILSHALSAPLVAVTGLPSIIRPTPAAPFVAILQYPWLTALAFFNEHGDLRLLRTLQHRGLRRPTNFRNALATSNAALEFIDPDLFLFPLGNNVDNTLDADLRIAFSGSRVETLAIPTPEGMPFWSPEPAIAANPSPREADSISSHTFTILRDEKWALQNFLPTPREIVEIYPNRSEMRILRTLRYARIAIALVAVVSLAYIGLGMFSLYNRKEWAFDPSQSALAKQLLAKYTQERQKSEQLGKLMEDRSKAWTSMESLAMMFPQDGAMLVKTYGHTVKTDNTPGKSSIGFVKEWRITGLARDEALDYLNTLNTREGISAHFTEVARVTGNSAFDPTIGSRNLVVNVRTQENSSFKPVPPEEASITDESTYPFTFDLTITQRFEANDPVALAVTKAKTP